VHRNCEAINSILATAGLPGRVQMLPEAATTARAAAEQIGCPVGAIANSLIFATDADEPVLIMVSGAHRVDLALVGKMLGTALHRAGPEFVRQHTGQPIGGVAPVGHPRPIPTVVDRDLAAYEELWAAGGIPHAVFPLRYAELLQLTGGRETAVA
jgi:prolyl-tRNA editing enzyme YbaK/EbsC (Cys-tRNA(Pro) deacylase)